MSSDDGAMTYYTTRDCGEDAEPGTGPTLMVAIALHEKQLLPTVIQQVTLNFLTNEQFEASFLTLSPRGEVPVLRHEGKVMAEPRGILAYLDAECGRLETRNKLFPADQAEPVRACLDLIESVDLFELAYAVGFCADLDLTPRMRCPFDRQPRQRFCLAERAKFLLSLAERRRPSHGLADKASYLTNLAQTYARGPGAGRTLLARVELVLDQVEAMLAAESRAGPWLCGPGFSAADVALIVLLHQLYLLGLDERLWLGGARPNLAVYQAMAFERPSVMKATGWQEVRNKFAYVRKSPQDEASKLAYTGMLGAAVLGGIYVCKTLWRK